MQWIRSLEESGLSVKIEIFQYFRDEKEAYDTEKELIQEYRKKNKIFNILPGGDPLCGPNNPMYGKKRPDKAAWNSSRKGKSLSELYGEERAETIKLKISRPGKNNGMFGKTREDLINRNKSQSGKSYEEIFGQEKANEIKTKLGGIKIIRNDEKIFYSIKSAAKETNTTKYLLKRHLDGHLSNVNGYTFRYVTQPIDIPKQS